ncbi:hypothetical protein K0M31_013461 [Melipona bicolor]|uniref:Uncharacterized protein n=1 Tax=Melipona bicolor TaxID=60889 RepID=A0AA40KGJ5_9HYME|nr:hypothetical protein K0M31_013461 [Melipona bicolor]
MKERENVLSPRNVATLPWKLEVEFDDTLTCKLYSQLSFSEEDDKFVAPPTSPIESFKYAPLTKFRKYCPFIPPHDVDCNNPSPLHNNSNVVKSSSVESRACTRNFISPKEGATLDTQDSSITTFKHREKEKLEFIEGRCVTKFYSKGSTISEDSIIDVNKNKRSNVQRDSSLEQNEGDGERKHRRENVQGKGFKEFSLSDVFNKESKRRFDLQPGLRMICKPFKENSRNVLTQVDRIQLASRKTDSLDEERLVEPKLRKQLALLTNRSSDNFCFGDSTSESCNREKYTFLGKRNVPWNYKRVVRLRSTANLLDFSNRWIKSPQVTSYIHQNLDSSRISDKIC